MTLAKTFRKALLSGMAAASFFTVAGGSKDVQAQGTYNPFAPRKHKNVSGTDTVTHCAKDNHTLDKAIYNTPGETALLKSIFGDSLDNSKAVKYFTGTGPVYEGAAAVACSAWATEYIGTDSHSKDFSKELNTTKYGSFVHENTHRWQLQNLAYFILCKEDEDGHKGKYHYTLTETSKFKDFCVEQQASIVQDYAVRFLHKLQSGSGTREEHALLTKVVEEQFPDAKNARLAAQAQAIKDGILPSEHDTVGTCLSENHAPGKGSPLTKGEAEMVRSIFGSGFDTSDIRKYLLPENPNHPGEISCRDKKSLEFYGKNYHAVDYSEAKNSGRPVNGMMFMRQITHLWQMRNGIAPDHAPENTYTVSPNTRFTDYGVKSQTSMIVDYKSRFLDSNHLPPQFMISKGADVEWLKNIVETQFPEAKKTRLAVEEKERLSPPPKPALIRPCAPADHAPGKGSPLTKGEAEMVRSIFGNDFDTSDIRKYLFPKPLTGHSPEMVCGDKKSLEFYGNNYHAADYSLTDTPDRMGNGIVFIRQITYLWQMRNGITYDLNNHNTYTLSPHARFTDYGRNSQTSLIIDYKRSFLDSKRWPPLFMNAKGADMETLKKIVEEQFPEAKKTRLKIEAQKQAAKTALQSTP